MTWTALAEKLEEISAKKKNLEELYTDLGKKYYAGSGSLEEAVSAIGALEQEIQADLETLAAATEPVSTPEPAIVEEPVAVVDAPADETIVVESAPADETYVVESAPAAECKCPNCGTLLEEGSLFCMNCGAKVTPDAPQPEEPKAEEAALSVEYVPSVAERRCQACNAVLDADAVFCAECGTRQEPIMIVDSRPSEEPVSPLPSTEEEPVVAEEPSAEPAKCRVCGAVLDEGTRFCAECGTPVAAPKEEELPKEEPPAAPVVRTCSRCGTILEDDVRFCPNCGTPAAGEAPKAPAGKICPNCGTVNEAKDLFCAECGTRLG